jgi:hypothetical protein
MTPARSPTPPSELAAALAGYRHAFIGIALFTAAINILQLTGPLFMLEVYDRVLPGRSVPTLVAIGILALVMFAFQGLLDFVRGRVLVRIAGSVDQSMSHRVFDLAAASARSAAARALKPSLRWRASSAASGSGKSSSYSALSPRLASSASQRLPMLSRRSLTLPSSLTSANVASSPSSAFFLLSSLVSPGLTSSFSSASPQVMSTPAMLSEPRAARAFKHRNVRDDIASAHDALSLGVAAAGEDARIANEALLLPSAALAVRGGCCFVRPVSSCWLYRYR